MCILQQNLSEDELRKEKLGKFGPNIIQLLSEWADMFPYDFRDERMMLKLKEITQRILVIYPELRPDVTNITHSLVKRVSINKVISYNKISLNKAKTHKFLEMYLKLLLLGNFS